MTMPNERTRAVIQTGSFCSSYPETHLCPNGYAVMPNFFCVTIPIRFRLCWRAGSKKRQIITCPRWVRFSAHPPKAAITPRSFVLQTRRPQMSDWDKAIAALGAARKIVFFTGAGVSAASGIPTFRDKLTGFWEKHDPEKLETARAFRENLNWFGGGTCGGAPKLAKPNQTPLIFRLANWRAPAYRFQLSLRILITCTSARDLRTSCICMAV